jgi:kumamolisin
MAIKKSAPRFSTQNRVVLPGSEKSTLAVAVTEKPTSPRGRVTVSVIVKRKKPLNAAALGKERMTWAQNRLESLFSPLGQGAVELLIYSLGQGSTALDAQSL